METTKQTIPYTHTREIFACIVNTDLTEGRGTSYAMALTECESTAVRLGKGRDVQGTDATIQRVKMFYVPYGHDIPCGWYAPGALVHTPNQADKLADKILQEEKAKRLLLDKFRKGEEISDEERKQILALLDKK